MKGSQNQLESRRNGDKAKYIKGCHILAEMTTQLNQNDLKPGKNVVITANSIVLAHN